MFAKKVETLYGEDEDDDTNGENEKVARTHQHGHDLRLLGW